MSGKNSAKVYVENGYYHIYNRGVEKRLIFQDAQDYGIFLSYLKDYLSPKDKKELRDKLGKRNISSRERDQIWHSLRMNNFSQEIILLAYCLMPNHFHLFVKQKNPESIDKFMNSLSTRYVIYFNRKYNRVGALYQDVYKAVLVNTYDQFLHLSRYIHKQSLQGDPLQGSQPSSYAEYIGARNTLWIHPEEVLSFFSDTKPNLSYEAFLKDSDDNSSLTGLVLEELTSG
jgi:putative transposase